MMPPPSRHDTEDMHSADVATFRSEISHLQTTFDDHDEKDNTQFNEMRTRLSRIEIALATVMGGLAVLGWLINQSANNILHLLGK